MYKETYRVCFNCGGHAMYQLLLDTGVVSSSVCERWLWYSVKKTFSVATNLNTCSPVFCCLYCLKSFHSFLHSLSQSALNSGFSLLWHLFIEPDTSEFIWYIDLLLMLPVTVCTVFAHLRRAFVLLQVSPCTLLK